MLRRCCDWLYAIPDEPQSILKRIAWWELRRIPYNLIIGVTGLISLLLFFLFINLAHELKSGEDAIEPIALLAAPFVINIAYTTGWIAELSLRLILRKRSNVLGVALFKFGLLVSIVVVLLPSVLWFVIWIVRSLGV